MSLLSVELRSSVESSADTENRKQCVRLRRIDAIPQKRRRADANLWPVIMCQTPVRYGKKEFRKISSSGLSGSGNGSPIPKSLFVAHNAKDLTGVANGEDERCGSKDDIKACTVYKRCQRQPVACCTVWILKRFMTTLSRLCQPTDTQYIIDSIVILSFTIKHISLFGDKALKISIQMIIIRFVFLLNLNVSFDLHLPLIRDVASDSSSSSTMACCVRGH